MGKDKPKDKDVSGKSVGRKHDPKITGPGWVKSDGNPARSGDAHGDWQNVDKDGKK
jgi:hypothetical protein